MAANTYAEDLALLREHTSIVELSDGAAARAAVAPAFQGRVMTSSLAGGAGASFGWLNREFIASGAEDAAFNNYGGEDRFWLGPEAGQFGLWFRQGEPFDLEHWRTPPGLGTGSFDVTSQGSASVAMAAQFQVTNYSGTTFDCAVQRTINLLDAAAAGELLGLPVPEGVRMVGFESENTLANAGGEPWTRHGGLVSIWILGQLKPLPRGKVIVPIRPGREVELGPRATTDYFGEVPTERCSVGEDCVLFACDGGYRSKIGVSPLRARRVFGSYDPDAGVLTIVQFSLPPSAPELPYVNSRWEIQDRPFAGDAVNSYNDGEVAPGAGQLGPFYEVETSSPAASLAPGQALAHTHRTFHLAGGPDELNALAGKLLGVDLGRI
jgi:hypothetical protein